MPTSNRIQRAAQRLAELVNFDEAASHLEIALQIDKMSSLAGQGKYKQAYELALSLIDAKKGSFSRFATEIGELVLHEWVLSLFERDRIEDAIQAMKDWLRRVPGHPSVAFRLLDSFMSPVEEMLAGVDPDKLLDKVLRQHPYALQPHIALVRRIAFLTLLNYPVRLITLVTHIWSELRQMEWVVYPTRVNVLNSLVDLFGATYRALVTPESQLRLRKIIAQVDELLKPDEKPLLTLEQFELLNDLNQTIQQYATPQEERELLEKIDVQLIQELLEDAEVYEQIEQWLSKDRFYHAYRKLIPFERWAQRPLHASFRRQAVFVVSLLSLQHPSREVKLDDLLRHTDEWAALKPDDPRPHFRKAMLLMQKNLPAEAISAAESAMSLSPKGIEPVIAAAVVSGTRPPDDPEQLKVLQLLQRAWQNLPRAQWVMPPHSHHVQGLLQILVGLTAIALAVIGGMRQEALQILDEGGELLGKNAPELKMARRTILSSNMGS